MATKETIASAKWDAKNCKRVYLKIRNDSGIPEALERVKIAGYSINSYVIKALREQLLDDGFLKEEE